MKIADHLDDFLDCLDIESSRVEPTCLSDIVGFVKTRREVNPITMFARNNGDSSNYLFDLCEAFIENIDEGTDLYLAALFVIASELDDDRYTRLASRASRELQEYRWSAAMAASYLLSKEVNNASVCISA